YRVKFTISGFCRARGGEGAADFLRGQISHCGSFFPAGSAYQGCGFTGRTAAVRRSAHRIRLLLVTVSILAERTAFV
ncbi:MAG: hypothetical protein COT06_01180, partial [Syntrophobacteraceae bacterium CG07_land_8_20_14_0_80_61_8]